VTGKYGAHGEIRVFARLSGMCRPDEDVVVRRMIVISRFSCGRFAKVLRRFLVLMRGSFEVFGDAGIVGIGFYSDRLHRISFHH